MQVNPLPKISVITYVKNGADFVARAIESVISQRYPNFEIIVVDGASTDGTVEIVNRYRSHLSHFISEPDSGAFEAANKGIALATGEIFLFVFADDWLVSGALASIGKAFAENPDCDIVSSGVAEVSLRKDGTYETVSERRGEVSKFSIDDILYLPLSMARYYRRKAVIAVGGLSGAYPITHDLDLLIRMLAAGCKSAVIDEILYIYLVHPKSNSLFYRPETMRRIFEEHLAMGEAHRHDPRLGNQLREVLADWVVEQHARLALLELREGNVVVAIGIGLREALYRPSCLGSLWRRYLSISAARKRLYGEAK